jgi:hypothetical protein
MSNRDIDKSFLRDLHGVGEVKIDATDPNNLSDQVLKERETRARLLKHARIVGCERDMLLLFAKADNTMRNCTNDKERKDMGKLFAISVYQLLGGGGELYIDGQLVMKDS